MPRFFFFNDTATTEIYTLSLHDALPISRRPADRRAGGGARPVPARPRGRRHDREAPGALPEGPLPLGPRGHVGGRQDRRPAARPLPEALGGAGAPQRRRAWGPARSRMARALPSSRRSVHRPDRHVGDFSLGGRRVLPAGRPGVAPP